MNVTAIQDKVVPNVSEDFVLETDCKISGQIGQESRRRSLKGEDFSKKAQMEFMDKSLHEAIKQEPDLPKVFSGLSKNQQHRSIFLVVKEAMTTKKKG